MKYKKILTWACTAALFLTGCTTDTVSNGGWMDDSNAVRIQASAGSTLTRSNPIDESKLTGFNQGDMISVRNRNITVNYTFDGEKLWVPENDKYLVWDEKDLKFEGYYPCDGKNTFSVGCIKKNQSTPEALAQSDYMNITSNLQSIPSDKRLTLELKRQTARLIFRIQKFNDEFSERVKVNKLEIYCPEKTNGETDDWDPITPYRQNGDGGVGTTYTALVIPGVINAELNTSESSYDSEGEPQALNLKTGELEAGKSYTYNLIVGKNKVTVGGVTVAPWNTENTLQGGEAEEEPPYVTMTAASNQTFKMTCEGTYTLPNLEYSVNNGTWLKVVAEKPVEFGGNLGSLRLRGKCFYGTAADYEDYSTITFSNPNVKVKCSGDIRTLIDYTAYKTVATASSCFCSLFNGCSVLTSAPELPATALKMWCYESMFKGCTSLTKAPVLPATELQQWCYKSMFEGCKSLDKAPDLPATKLELRCYEAMFKGCTELKQAPKLSAEELAWYCYSNMFEGCTSLVNAPALPATILNDYCYQSMFSGCTSLKTAPKLGAAQIEFYCYHWMFENCTNLESVTMLATSAENPNGLVGWLNGAGTKAKNRTLKVDSKDFYNSTIVKNNPKEWKIGANCTVLDKDNKEITE